MWVPRTLFGRLIQKMLIKLAEWFIYPEFRRVSITKLKKAIKFVIIGFIIYQLSLFLTDFKESREKVKLYYYLLTEQRDKALEIYFAEAMDSVRNTPEYMRFQIYNETGIEVPKKLPARIMRVMIDECERNEVPLKIAIKVMRTESRFDSSAVSPVGAFGYMQLMPATFSSLYKKHKLEGGRTTTNNVILGIRMLGDLYKKWKEKKPDKAWELALASYNAGPGIVDSLGGVPPYKETQNYIQKILHSED